ncbi:MAG: hemoglobin-like protein [Phycisphaeraceae bacterium]|nr:MAG: hemoglobin-like protein [Phycisphaeraceae bacterium]
MELPTQAEQSGGGGFGPGRLPYDEIGGDAGVRRLVDEFYDRVRDDSEVMRRLHPEDLTESREKLFEFLSGWLGGPQLYVQKHGHPRLRMRHMPFAIDEEAVREWLRCMRGAMDACAVEGELRAFLEERFRNTAEFMRNC